MVMSVFLSQNEVSEIRKSMVPKFLSMVMQIEETTGRRFIVTREKVYRPKQAWWKKKTGPEYVYAYTILAFVKDSEWQVVDLFNGYHGQNMEQEVFSFLYGIMMQINYKAGEYIR